MMSMSYLFLFFISILYLTFFFKYPQILQKVSFESFSFFVKIMIPSIIPMYLLSNIILNNKVTQQLMSILKPIFHKFDCSYSISLFITNIIVGNPTGIINIIKALKAKVITTDDAAILIECSSFMNPLFIITFCKLNKLESLATFLIISNILANYIIFLSHKTKKMNIQIENYKLDIISIINNSSTIILNIFSIFYFINILKAPLNILKLPNEFLIIFDFIEISSGLNHISSSMNSNYLKYLLITILVTFTGLSILLQSINEIKKAPNNRCLIRLFLKGRLYQMIIVIFLFLIFFK